MTDPESRIAAALLMGNPGYAGEPKMLAKTVFEIVEAFKKAKEEALLIDPNGLPQERFGISKQAETKI